MYWRDELFILSRQRYCCVYFIWINIKIKITLLWLHKQYMYEIEIEKIILNTQQTYANTLRIVYGPHLPIHYS